MAQLVLGGVRGWAMCAWEATPGPTSRRAVALALLLSVLATTTGAQAQETLSPESVRARDESRCAAQLAPLERAIEHDWRYAVSWRDAWLVTGFGLVALNAAAALTDVDAYRRSENIVFAAQSLLLLIQVPVAVSSKGLRSVEDEDPCYALLDAIDILRDNEDDYRQHTNAAAHIAAIAIPIITQAILIAATGHFDFVGNGNEGLTPLVAAAIGELQVLTYPRPSIKVTGPSLTVQF